MPALQALMQVCLDVAADHGRKRDAPDEQTPDECDRGAKVEEEPLEEPQPKRSKQAIGVVMWP